MIQEAEEYAESDRERNGGEAHCAESLTVEAERELKQVALDFDAVCRNRRQRIEPGNRESLAQDNDRGIDQPMLTFKMPSMS